MLLFSARNTTSLFGRCMTKAIYVIDSISGKIIYNSALVVQGKTILFHLLKLNTQNVNIHTNWKKIITHLSSYPPNNYRKGDRYVDKTSLVTRKNPQY